LLLESCYAATVDNVYQGSHAVTFKNIFYSDENVLNVSCDAALEVCTSKACSGANVLKSLLPFQANQAR
jgi:hypothetical protein